MFQGWYSVQKLINVHGDYGMLVFTIGGEKMNKWYWPSCIAIWSKNKSGSQPHTIYDHKLEWNFFFLIFIAPPAGYVHSQARGHIGAAAARLYHSHSNTESEPHL